MKSTTAVVGFAGKGSFNTPTKIDNVKDLHSNFGHKSNLVSVAEQILYGDHNPTVVRLEEYGQIASAYLTDTDDTICMMIKADSIGVTGTFTTVEVTRNPDSFNLLVFNGGEMVEFWGNLKPGQAEEIINFTSKWINVSEVKGTWPAKAIVELQTEKNITKPVMNLQNAINSLEHLDLEFISIPDCDSPEIINAVLRYLEEEKPGTTLVINPPWESDLLQTYKWCKNLIPSDHGVIFWPWLNCGHTTIPSSGPILAAILNWPFPWKSIRTKLAGVTDIAFGIHHDELAYISKQEHFINLINKKNGSLILDNRILTLAGNKLSERRLLNYIETKISRLGIELLSMHNPVNNNFRNNFIESSEYILEQVKDDQGINNFKLRINELSNPEDFEVSLDLMMKDSVEIVNIYFKFTK